MKQYILLLENEKNNPYIIYDLDLINDTAYEYLIYLNKLETILIKKLPNDVVRIAINSFLFNTALEIDEVIKLVSPKKKEIQYFITQINDFRYSTTKTKQFQIEYLENKIKNKVL